MLDILVIAVIAIYALNGWRKGLIFSVISIIGYIVSLGLARAYSPSLTEVLMNNTGIGTWMDGFLSSKIKAASQMDLAADMLSGLATQTVMNVLSFFLIFSITSMIIFNIAKILNGVGRLPVIGKINKIGGMIFGASKSLLIIFVVLAISFFIVNTGNEKLAKSIEDTILVDVLYKNNPILTMINEIMEVPEKTEDGYI